MSLFTRLASLQLRFRAWRHAAEHLKSFNCFLVAKLEEMFKHYDKDGSGDIDTVEVGFRERPVDVF